MTTAVDELKTVLTRHQRDWAAPWASDGHGTLVGRGADLDRIGVFIAGVPRAGGPLLLMGEPGAGKTALPAAGGRQAKASEICVLAHCRGGVQGTAELRRRAAAAGCRGRQAAIHRAFRAVDCGAGACGRPGTWTRGSHGGHAVVAAADGAQQADAGGRRTTTPKPIPPRTPAAPACPPPVPRPSAAPRRPRPAPRRARHRSWRILRSGPAAPIGPIWRPANSQDERSTFVQPRRIGPRHRCGPSRCGHRVRPGEDWAIGRFAAAPHRHDTGQEAPVHAAWHR